MIAHSCQKIFPGTCFRQRETGYWNHHPMPTRPLHSPEQSRRGVSRVVPSSVRRGCSGESRG